MYAAMWMQRGMPSYKNAKYRLMSTHCLSLLPACESECPWAAWPYYPESWPYYPESARDGVCYRGIQPEAKQMRQQCGCGSPGNYSKCRLGLLAARRGRPAAAAAAAAPSLSFFDATSGVTFSRTANGGDVAPGLPVTVPVVPLETAAPFDPADTETWRAVGGGVHSALAASALCACVAAACPTTAAAEMTRPGLRLV